MQPVTITLPFSAMRLADGAPAILALALSRKPQVLTMTEVGAVMLAGELVTLGPEPGDDPLGIHQRLGAAKRDKPTMARAGAFMGASKIIPEADPDCQARIALFTRG